MKISSMFLISMHKERLKWVLHEYFSSHATEKNRKRLQICLWPNEELTFFKMIRHVYEVLLTVREELSIYQFMIKSGLQTRSIKINYLCQKTILTWENFIYLVTESFVVNILLYLLIKHFRILIGCSICSNIFIYWKF
jgi:hypothetical protein